MLYLLGAYAFEEFYVKDESMIPKKREPKRRFSPIDAGVICGFILLAIYWEDLVNRVFDGTFK